jgi:hypothetical protein
MKKGQQKKGQRSMKVVTPTGRRGLLRLKIEGLEAQFTEQARLFKAMMDPKHGGGIHCVAMLDTLRQLQFLFLDIAAHRHALDSAEGTV